MITPLNLDVRHYVTGPRHLCMAIYLSNRLNRLTRLTYCRIIVGRFPSIFNVIVALPNYVSAVAGRPNWIYRVSPLTLYTVVGNYN